MNYTGNDIDLIHLETDIFTLVIKGKPVHPDINQLYIEENKNLSLKALLDLNPIACKVESFSHYSPSGGLMSGNNLTSQVYPFFYEQQDYLVFIDGKDDNNLEFYHENKHVRESVSKYPGKSNQLMGMVNFRNDVGSSELEIRCNGKTLLIMTIEIFPSKIDYQSDYYSLLQEVNQEIYNLAYGFLRRTFQGTKLKEASNISLVEFFNIIRVIFNNFIKAYRRVEKYPHHRLNQMEKILPAAQVKKINRQSIKWLRRNRRFYNKELGIPTRMLNIDKQISFDTFENRFIKWIIVRVLKKINIFKTRYKNIYGDNVEGAVIKIIDRMKKKLDFILKNSFLQKVGDLYKIDSLSLVLQMAPGYREVYKYYLMLQKGLSINGEIFKLSMKQIWELYEYWCFLELNSILSEKYRMVKHDLIDVNYSGIYVKLNKGRGSSVEYENQKTGERFKLTYNQSEGEKITTGQKPDNVLTLKKEGSKVEYKFIFDAKYRINPAYPDTNYYKTYRGIPGPEEDTINTMHRYRDAIIKSYQDYSERIVVGAFVLFPYHDEERFKEHHFYKSIEEVNVGAFPFLPGSTKLITGFLKTIIEESYLGNYERNIQQAGTKDYSQGIRFEQNVLVGSLSKKKQLDICLNECFYHIPYQKSILNNNLKYLALFQSKNKFGSKYGVNYYGKIKGIEVKKRSEINIPTTKDPYANYIVFYIDKWEKLDNKIEPEGYGVIGSHIYTNIMLLEKARTIPELSINTIEEWRTWIELKRIQKDVKVLLEDNNISFSTIVKGFQVEDMIIKIKDGNILIEKNNKKTEFSGNDFLYNLRGVMKRLYGIQ